MDIKYFYVYDYQIKKPIGKLVLNQNNGVPIKNEQGQYIKQDNNIDSLIRKIWIFNIFLMKQNHLSQSCFTIKSLSHYCDFLFLVLDLNYWSVA